MAVSTGVEVQRLTTGQFTFSATWYLALKRKYLNGRDSKAGGVGYGTGICASHDFRGMKQL